MVNHTYNDTMQRQWRSCNTPWVFLFKFAFFAVSIQCFSKNYWQLCFTYYKSSDESYCMLLVVTTTDLMFRIVIKLYNDVFLLFYGNVSGYYIRKCFRTL